MVSSDGLSVRVDDDPTRNWWYASRFIPEESTESEENSTVNVYTPEYTADDAIKFIRNLGYLEVAALLEKEYNRQKDPEYKEYKEYLRLRTKFSNKE